MVETVQVRDFFDPEEETLEELGRKGFRMIQRRDGFRFGEDTVLLAHFCASAAPKTGKCNKVLELGAGCGAASLLLSARRPDLRIDAVEIDPVSFGVFSRNILLNGLEERIFPILGDVRKYPDSVRIKKSGYDFVFFNAPYRKPERGPMTRIEANSESLLGARFEIFGGIRDFLRCACEALKPGGMMALVHRPVRLPEILRAISEAGAEPRVLRMIYPNDRSEATAFLLVAQKGAKPGGFVVEAPLILRDSENEMKSEMIEIYSKEE